MDLKELEINTGVMLNQFKVSFKKMNMVRGVSVQFIINDFGLLVCNLDRRDYSQIQDVILKYYGEWRIFYITTVDNMMEKRDQLLWELMRCGYMKWLRFTFPRQIKSIINGPENLGQKIIRERLRIWGDKPKYKFFIEDNKMALKNGMIREIGSDPGFFDTMPEEIMLT